MFNNLRTNQKSLPGHTITMMKDVIHQIFYQLKDVVAGDENVRSALEVYSVYLKQVQFKDNEMSLLKVFIIYPRRRYIKNQVRGKILGYSSS